MSGENENQMRRALAEIQRNTGIAHEVARRALDRDEEYRRDLHIGTGTVQADVGTEGVSVGSSNTGSLMLPWNLIIAVGRWAWSLIRKKK